MTLFRQFVSLLAQKQKQGLGPDSPFLALLVIIEEQKERIDALDEQLNPTPEPEPVKLICDNDGCENETVEGYMYCKPCMVEFKKKKKFERDQLSMDFLYDGVF